MRCRRCKLRFRLHETIWVTGPPGAPITPGGSLVFLLPVLAATAVMAVIRVGFRRDAVAFVTGVAVLLYLWHYAFYWLLAKDPNTRKRPGTCPHCGTYNVPMPWSI